MSSAPKYPRSSFTLEDCLVEPTLNRVSGPCGTQHIQPRVMLVLVRLASQVGECVSRDQLLKAGWEGAPYVADEALTKAISTLRSALSSCTRKSGLIRTIPKRGYVLDASLYQDPARPTRMKMEATLDTAPVVDNRVPLPIMPKSTTVRIWQSIAAAVVLVAVYGLGVQKQPESGARIRSLKVPVESLTDIPEGVVLNDNVHTLLKSVGGVRVMSDSVWTEPGDPRVVKRRIALVSGSAGG